MNIVERDAIRTLENAADAAPAQEAPAPARGAGAQAAPAVVAPALCRPLSLAGMCRRGALLAAAIATLVVPIAIRRMIDFGFSRDSAVLIDSYFTVMIAVVAVLALASAARLYLVTTLGERIVADLREEVFGHLVSLSPPISMWPRAGN